MPRQNNNNYVNNSNNVNDNSIVKDNNIINCNRNSNINNMNTVNNSNNCKNNENNIKLYNVDDPNVRNLKYYFPIEDVDRYMRDGIIPQDCTFYRPNKDFCSIYLCDYLPLTNNTTMINDLTINDNTSKYNEKYKSKMKKKCLKIKEKFFSTNGFDDYTYPTSSFRYKHFNQQNIKTIKSQSNNTKHKYKKRKKFLKQNKS